MAIYINIYIYIYAYVYGHTYIYIQVGKKNNLTLNLMLRSNDRGPVEKQGRHQTSGVNLYHFGQRIDPDWNQPA